MPMTSDTIDNVPSMLNPVIVIAPASVVVNSKKMLQNNVQIDLPNAGANAVRPSAISLKISAIPIFYTSLLVLLSSADSLSFMPSNFFTPLSSSLAIDSL